MCIYIKRITINDYFSTDWVVSTTHENITLLLVLYKLQLHETALNCFRRTSLLCDS